MPAWALWYGYLLLAIVTWPKILGGCLIFAGIAVVRSGSAA